MAEDPKMKFEKNFANFFNVKKRTEETHLFPSLPDMCRCSSCGKERKIDDCIKDYGHHNGWEMPPYTEILCPDCIDDGCIDDVFFSDEALFGGSDENI